MRVPCPHGSVLPKGLKCDNGYLVIRLKSPKLNKGCGPHTKEQEKIAVMCLARIRERQYLGTFELPQKVTRLKFKEAAAVFKRRHFDEYKHPDTHKPRSKSSLEGIGYLLKVLITYFGDMYLDDIGPKDVKGFKTQRIEFDGCLPGTFNREKGILSSIFTQFAHYNQFDDSANPTKLPNENPCKFVPQMKAEKRIRVASIDELKRIKAACIEFDDKDLWTIICKELETTLRRADLKKFKKDSMEMGKTGRKVELPGIEGAGVEFTNLRKRWEAVRLKAVCADIQFRDLRRTGAHMLKTLGTSLSLIKDSLGHASERMTEAYLNYKDPTALRPALEARRKLLDSI